MSNLEVIKLSDEEMAKIDQFGKAQPIRYVKPKWHVLSLHLFE